MKIHIVTLLAVATLLSACTDQDWEHALTYTGMGGSQQNQSQARPAAAAQPVATAGPAPMTAQAATSPAPAPIPDGAQPQPNAFCESVAAQDAQKNDFDPPTQRRVFVQSYQQCVAVFGDVTK
jgi:hypothetical protein